MAVIDEIKKPRSKVFRDMFIKRRLASTGQFETDWQRVSTDVKKWGNITVSTTPERPDDIKFNTLKITMANNEGRYNDATDINSIWSGYAPAQRSLVKIEFGFINETKTNGVWRSRKVPHSSSFGWDSAFFDEDYWDVFEDSIEYHGIIYGDIDLSDKNEVVLTVAPLTQLFRDYPARRLNGYGSGLTAQQFFEMVRDHQDGGGNYIFRPFFGNTSTGFDIQSTTVSYTNLNSPTANDVIDASTWDIMARLAVAENYIPFVDYGGIFKFKNKVITGGTEFDFYGNGFFNNTYGHTIKSIDRFGQRISALYTRVQIKFREDDTATSYVVSEADLTISAANLPWVYGYRTLALDNNYIPNTTTAQGLADTLRSELESLKSEIEFTTSFIPHLKILDPVRISYSTEIRQADTVWDANNWTTQLRWKQTTGDALDLNLAEYFLTKIVVDLDKFECKFTAREQ